MAEAACQDFFTTRNVVSVTTGPITADEESAVIRGPRPWLFQKRIKIWAKCVSHPG